MGQISTETVLVLDEDPQLDAATMESVLLSGDLSRLSTQQRVNYYLSTCHSLGLNPRTKPFAYLQLNGKLTLYALRDCAEQLRSTRNVSVQIVAREMMRDGELYVVTARASMPTPQGIRTDESTGAVALGKLTGENLANALMKAETKAKRRVTLSICGLGMLDENEVVTIPGAAVMPAELPVAQIAGQAAPSAPAAPAAPPATKTIPEPNRIATPVIAPHDAQDEFLAALEWPTDFEGWMTAIAEAKNIADLTAIGTEIGHQKANYQEKALGMMRGAITARRSKLVTSGSAA